MKKSILLLGVAIFSTGLLRAQTEFAPLGATWYYGNMESMFGDTGFTKTTVTDSAVIDGKKVKVLISEYHASSGGVFPRDTIYAYQTGDSVLFYRDGDFHLVYNFGLNVGDTMELYNPDNKTCPIYDWMDVREEDLMYGHVVVESIKTLDINGTQLKEFNFVSADPDSYYSRFSDRYHYIEKIGTTTNLFGEDCIADNFGGGIFGDLRCYEDEEIGHYQYSRAACDSIFKFDWEAYYEWAKQEREKLIGIDDVCAESGFSVIYSSVNRTIIICLQDNCTLSHIIIVDSDGHILYDDICQSEANINIPLQKTGLYIIQVKNDNGTYYEKIIAY